MSIQWFRNLINQISNDQANLYEMANISPTETGLPVTVFCSPRGGAKHECRVKVTNIRGGINEHDVFSIDIKDLSIIGHCKLSSNDLESVKWWIHRNRFVILDYWKHRITTTQFINSIKSITTEE